MDGILEDGVTEGKNEGFVDAGFKVGRLEINLEGRNDGANKIELGSLVGIF